jgi:hypothetical protein
MSSLRSRTKAKSKATRLRTWKRHATAAEAVAARTFDLTEYQRSRLIVRERV